MIAAGDHAKTVKSFFIPAVFNSFQDDMISVKIIVLVRINLATLYQNEYN